MSQPTTVEFDLDRYLRNSKKVDLSGIDWAEIPDHPLSNGDVMCLHYMMDIETHTVIYLRDLLATRVAADPQITAFLSMEDYLDAALLRAAERPGWAGADGVSTPAPTKATPHRPGTGRTWARGRTSGPVPASERARPRAPGPRPRPPPRPRASEACR